MGQWVSSKEFAGFFGITDRAVRKQAQTKKILKFNTKYFSYTYTKGIGGYSGKILQIWNTPLSQKQVEALEKGYPIKYVLEEMGEEESVNKCKDSNSRKVSKVQRESICICSNTNCDSSKVQGADSKLDAVSDWDNKEQTTQPNVMESKDFKTLDCKGDKDETYKTIKQNEAEIKQDKTESLHTRGADYISKRDCNTTSRSDSSLYRDDCSNGRVDKENCTTWHNLTPNQKAQAKHREKILIDYESAKLSGIQVKHFIELKNKEDSALKLTEGKLFDWQRKYKTQGLSALSDKRGIAKLGVTSLPAWAQQEAIKIWRVLGSGYFNRMQLWRELHIIAHLYVKDYSYKKFLKCEIPPLFSLNTLNRFLDSYLKKNSLEYTLITYGTDKTDSYKEPALGIQRDLTTLPNQLWQIDSSPLDAIVLDGDERQMRPSVLSVIDVYSGRSVALLSETSDSNAVIRLMWKAFESMGKPEAIQFDNGKDYLSN
ncbi:MAG: transposase family protein, partial [Helicobacter sp.]|nr:transposase family protein [Helicobacter sp.]